jgi:hypothetical protein
MICTLEPDGSILCDESTRLIHPVLFNQDNPGQDHGSGPLTCGRDPPVDEKVIQPDFRMKSHS